MSVQIALRNFLHGVNINDGPLYLASPSLTGKFCSFAFNGTRIPDYLNNILYTICNVFGSEDNVVISRIKEEHLERSLQGKWSVNSILNGFLLAADPITTKPFRSNFLVQFNDEVEDNTKNVIEFAKEYGIPFISKLVPNSTKTSYSVDVISCMSEEIIDQFQLLPVKYDGYHPALEFGHSVFKSFVEVQKTLEIASQSLSLPEVKILKDLSKEHSNDIFAIAEPSTYLNPFIVVEGLDGVGKTTLVTNLARRIKNAQLVVTPPQAINEYRQIMVKQCQPLCRAFYSLGNYLTAKIVKDSLMFNTVVLDRYWHSSAAYAIALESKCGNERNIPTKGHPLYKWPEDLMKPSAVIFLELGEEDRIRRLRGRSKTGTTEEILLEKSQLLRQRVSQDSLGMHELQ
ncbi:UMP-CMP kinase 2, mitochondrial-like isoform X2 [Xenia sp. Carnegie-2017]|uniref:UMP-CMP kinase 2, mitochondrial-like isoform X2 n=1 Tax=Xenia sp. Carnegie-2017 TaxID=2897299 RepID=UPI001F03324F|nr:UMP-CMP kinase 2, mitochondrial-like isoform X2 [Xenia sp. Carnegie-2017]